MNCRRAPSTCVVNNMTPLNPTLYRLLCERFGQVRIAKQGMAAVANRRRPAIPNRADKRDARLRFLTTGEEYRLCCPFCSDTRFRLWINHNWGVPSDDGDNWWMVHCYNEECQSDVGNIAQLKELVYGRRNRNARASMRINPGERTSLEPKEVEPPGAVILLDRLEEAHPAWQYVVQRGFDPVQLAMEYGVGYCAESHIPVVSGRIVVPIRMHGKLVGWQARYVGELDWRQGVPKYYGCPGMVKSALLYNLDVAKRSQFVVVAEGVTDVWKIGRHGVALFGKTLSVSQMQRLIAVWGRGALILLLDADAWLELEGMERELVGYFRHGVVKVFLPAGVDPGGLIHEQIWDLIAAAASEQNVNITEHLRRE